MSMRKSTLEYILAACGLRIEGDETVKELTEAYHYVRQYRAERGLPQVSPASVDNDYPVGSAESGVVGTRAGS